MSSVYEIEWGNLNRDIVLFLQRQYRLIQRLRLPERETKIIHRIPGICHHCNHNLPYIHPCFSLLYKQVEYTEQPIIFIGCHCLVKHSVQISGCQYMGLRYLHTKDLIALSTKITEYFQSPTSIFWKNLHILIYWYNIRYPRSTISLYSIKTNTNKNLAYLYTPSHRDKPSHKLLQIRQTMGFTRSSGCHSASEAIAWYCSLVKTELVSFEHSYSHGSS